MTDALNLRLKLHPLLTEVDQLSLTGSDIIYLREKSEMPAQEIATALGVTLPRLKEMEKDSAKLTRKQKIALLTLFEQQGVPTPEAAKAPRASKKELSPMEILNTDEAAVRAILYEHGRKTPKNLIHYAAIINEEGAVLHSDWPISDKLSPEQAEREKAEKQGYLLLIERLLKAEGHFVAGLQMFRQLQIAHQLAIKDSTRLPNDAPGKSSELESMGSLNKVVLAFEGRVLTIHLDSVGKESDEELGEQLELSRTNEDYSVPFYAVVAFTDSLFQYRFTPVNEGLNKLISDIQKSRG